MDIVNGSLIRGIRFRRSRNCYTYMQSSSFLPYYSVLTHKIILQLQTDWLKRFGKCIKTSGVKELSKVNKYAQDRSTWYLSEYSSLLGSVKKINIFISTIFQPHCRSYDVI